MGRKNLKGILNIPLFTSLNLTKITMKKALRITGRILYFIIALSPIFALGYMLGLKLS